jgi:capsule polysaccharide export protein KpsE/RkpR
MLLVSWNQFAVLQAHIDSLQHHLQEQQKSLQATQDEMERRCASFQCQLQSACSECTAAAEENIAVELQSLKKRVADALVRITFL